MEQTFNIAYEYCVKFHSFKGLILKFFGWFILLTVVGVVFLSSLFLLALNFYENGTPKSALGFIRAMQDILVLEFIYLFILSRLDCKRRKLLTKKYLNHSPNTRLLLSKRKWILSITGYKETEYLDYIKKIDTIQNAHTIKKPNKQRSGLFFPSLGWLAKALATLALTLISSLTIHQIENTYELISSKSKTIVLIIVLLAFSAILTTIIIISIRSVWNKITFWFFLFTGNKTGTYIFIDLFKRDLAYMHRLPTIRTLPAEAKPLNMPTLKNEKPDNVSRQKFKSYWTYIWRC